ncbi:glycogen phosphorylase, partial [Carpediemonas membranifera]
MSPTLISRDLEASVKDYASFDPHVHTLFNDKKDKSPAELQAEIVNHVKYSLGRTKTTVDNFGLYQATALTLRSSLLNRWNRTQEEFIARGTKQVSYLSLEWLMGRALTNGMLSDDQRGAYANAVQGLGGELEDLEEEEMDAALGNGGLGRLAACYVDSCASLSLPVWGYGLRYQYGMFKQDIKDGYQVETPEYWLTRGNPHELERNDVQWEVKLFGNSTAYYDSKLARTVYKWENYMPVRAVAYDTLCPGYSTKNVLNIRLWAARPCTEFDFFSHNHGDYLNAVRDKLETENITSVLYPNDGTDVGRRLRLKQQYFFTSASLQDMINRFRSTKAPLSRFHEYYTIQLNDTHPTLAVAELMRLLIDEHGFEWEDAWSVVIKTFAYTNHTVLPEALEKWPVHMIQHMLPRHHDIICEIDRRFCEMAYEKLHNNDDVHAMRIVKDGNIHMANLAIVGSFAVNGVAAIHSEIIRKQTFASFAKLWPEKFQNKTNGVTFRRWLRQANPELTSLITETLVNDGVVTSEAQWVMEPEKYMPRLLDHADEDDFIAQIADIKRANKERLAALILKKTGIEVSTEAIFDIQVKRIHEYKRQLLNVLAVIHKYKELKTMVHRGESIEHVMPRVSIFGGKAAPGYEKAKLIIKLINSVAEVINADESIEDKLKVVFIPSYNVSSAETIIPGCDVSEQISTAGMEASLVPFYPNLTQRHWQHEVRRQRRSHHRHYGRRQHRDPRVHRPRAH